MRILVLMLSAVWMAASTAPALAQPQREEWKFDITRHIARHMRLAVPRLQWALSSDHPMRGVAVVRIVAGPGGHVKSASIIRSSGHSYVDRTVVQVVQNASPLPRVPAAGASFILPVSLDTGPFKVEYRRY
jgi:protein TonB